MPFASSRSTHAEFTNKLVDPGQNKFEVPHVSLREYELHQVRAIVWMLFQKGPISATHRGDGVPGKPFVVAVNRHGVPGTLLVFQ